MFWNRKHRSQWLEEWLPVVVNRLVKTIQSSASDIVEALDRQTEAFQEADKELLERERAKAQVWIDAKRKVEAEDRGFPKEQNNGSDSTMPEM